MQHAVVEVPQRQGGVAGKIPMDVSNTYVIRMYRDLHGIAGNFIAVFQSDKDW